MFLGRTLPSTLRLNYKAYCGKITSLKPRFCSPFIVFRFCTTMYDNSKIYVLGNPCDAFRLDLNVPFQLVFFYFDRIDRGFSDLHTVLFAF